MTLDWAWAKNTLERAHVTHLCKLWNILLLQGQTYEDRRSVQEPGFRFFFPTNGSPTESPAKCNDIVVVLKCASKDQSPSPIVVLWTRPLPIVAKVANLAELCVHKRIFIFQIGWLTKICSIKSVIYNSTLSQPFYDQVQSLIQRWSASHFKAVEISTLAI